jgi:hypothetical protein
MQYSFRKFFSMQVYFGCCLIKGREREKKKSLETVLWMAICGCGLPAHCCQPALAGGFIYADVRSELNTHLALQALFTQSFPVPDPLLQAFPFPSTLGEVTLHPLSQAGMFIYSSREKWAFPPLPLSFPPSTTFTSFPTPGCWACATDPVFSHSACLFTALWGISLPPSSALRVPHPLCYVSFLLLLLLIIQFFFFPWVGVGLSRGLGWSGPGLLSHFVVHIFPSHPYYLLCQLCKGIQEQWLTTVILTT